jgi:paraquat-inducible protein A
MPTPTGKIKVCKQCDLAVELAPPEKGEIAVCPWCMGPMARHHIHPFELSLSLALAALVPFAIVLAYPFLSLSIAGLRETSTVVEISGTLWKKGFPSLGLVVFWMSIGLPGLRLLAYIYVLAPLRRGGPAPYSWLVFRLAEKITPWAMLDVFLIGVLVAVVKLRDLASVNAGVGLFAFVTLMLLAIGSSATLDREAVWDRIGRGAA